jgi:hypothetical protein
MAIIGKARDTVVRNAINLMARPVRHPRPAAAQYVRGAPTAVILGRADDGSTVDPP